jgi:hypothetical protein
MRLDNYTLEKYTPGAPLSKQNNQLKIGQRFKITNFPKLFHDVGANSNAREILA